MKTIYTFSSYNKSKVYIKISNIKLDKKHDGFMSADFTRVNIRYRSATISTERDWTWTAHFNSPRITKAIFDMALKKALKKIQR